MPSKHNAFQSSKIVRMGALLLACSCASAHAQSTLDRIRARGAVVIAHREASIPFSYVVDGRPVGYAIDICRKVIEAIGKQLDRKDLRVEHKLVTPATRFDVLERGEADLECGSTTNTAERRKRVAFTIPHFVASARLMVLASSAFERLEDLDRRTIASTTGTTNINSVAQEAQLKGIVVRMEAAKDHAEAVAWVLSGKVDAFAMDDVLLYGLRANTARPESLKVVGKPITIEPYAIGFQQNDSAFKKLVDGEMRRLITTQELHQIYAKWFLSPIPPHGVNLNMQMPRLFSDSLKYPSDFVPN